MKISISIVFLLLGIISNVGAQCNGDDFKALKDLYESTNGVSWTNNSGWSLVANNASPPAGCNLSTLFGINLNGNGRVEAVQLNANNLTGSLSTTISRLSELRSLNLRNNKMSGTIPSNLGEITTLESLQLQENDLGGTTGFTGPIPITGTNFPALRILRLNKNSLSGGIPVGLGLTTTIEEIGIHNNELNGTLPASLGYLPNLTNLKLFNNGISGCIPPSYFALCNQLTNVNIDGGNFLSATWASFCLEGTGVCDAPFITTWKTDNLGINGSCSSCIIIPTDGGTGYNYDIDWENDGTYDAFNVSGDIMHDYVTPGTYQVVIRGNFPRILFSGTGENLKILSVDQWGDNRWFSMASAFHTCSNLNILATDEPTLTDVTDMSAMFSTASSLDADISHWNVSKVTNMFATFFNTPSFNEDLSSWNIANVTDMASMFNSSGLDENNYDQTIIGWSEQDVQSNVTVGAQNLTYCASQDARQILENKGWAFTGDTNSCTAPESFITTWKTDNLGTSCSSCITIQTEGAGYNYDVDWNNDGVFDELGITGDKIHDFGSDGTYTIAIRGDFPRIYFNNTRDKDKILSVDQWGDIEWSNMGRAFYGCSNLTITATDSPDLSGVINMAIIFKGCSSLNANLSLWDVSSISFMDNAFDGATAFNSPLDWGNKTANVTSMRNMFYDASSFNQDLSGWDVSSVVDMSTMFREATSFNSPLGWGSQTSQVKFMGTMFRGAISFDQDISNWNVSSAINMAEMFRGATSFNSPLDWGSQTSQVDNMLGMFYDASSFNQNISDWDVSNVIIMTSMFQGASDFNSPLDWGDNTSQVTSMSSMFEGAIAFNQDVSGWNISTVSTMHKMFNDASSFDQDLSDWDISNVISLDLILSGSGLSSINYDNTLIGWADLPSPPQNVNILGIGLFYCNSFQARQTLINDYNWTFGFDMQDSGTNSFDQNPSSDWQDKSNWSLLRTPSTCNDLFLDAGGNAIIMSGEEGFGATLEVNMGSELIVNSGASLEIIFTPQ